MKYIQLHAVHKDDPSFPMDWILHKEGKTPGYRLLINSVFTWIKLFEGSIAWPAGLPNIELDSGEIVDLTSYDGIVHVHVTGENFELVNQVKAVAPNVKVLASVDYGLRLWGVTPSGFQSVDAVKRALEKADFVFGVEPEQCGLLSEATGRKVSFIPHPYNIEMTEVYKQGYTTPKEAACLCHRYDSDYHQPHLVFYNLPIMTVLLGSPPGVMGKYKGIVYSKVYEHTAFEFLLNKAVASPQMDGAKGGILPGAYMAYDSYGLKVFGRWQLDCAALGIPCIGSNLAFSQEDLFPELTTGYYEVTKQREMARHLIEDESFRDKCAEYARRKLGAYGFDAARERMYALVGETVQEVSV